MFERFDFDPVKVILILGMVACTCFSILTAREARRHVCLPEMLFSRMQKGHTYQVRQQDNGIWEVRSDNYQVHLSCGVAN